MTQKIAVLPLLPADQNERGRHEAIDPLVLYKGEPEVCPKDSK